MNTNAVFFDHLAGLRQPTHLPRQAVVYGAGAMGKRAAQLLKDAGVDVRGMLDRNAREGAAWESMPISRPDQWAATHPPGRCAVVVAIHNPAHDLGGLDRELRSMGFQQVLTLIDLCNLLPHAARMLDGFWLSSFSHYEQHIEELERLQAIWADDESRRTIRNVVEFRVSGAWDRLNPPHEGQYFPPSLPRWRDPLRFVDCGAFVGDTVSAALAAHYRIEAAVCLEPDPANYDLLVDSVRTQQVPAICLPCAVAERASILRFSAHSAGSSHLDADGDVAVQAIALDQSFPCFEPNLIKMDIEGAEIGALHGARRTIEQHRPGLAISIYHRPEHLWQIPLLLFSWLPDYQFFVRAHAHNTFDVVLYAIPA